MVSDQEIEEFLNELYPETRKFVQGMWDFQNIKNHFICLENVRKFILLLLPFQMAFPMLTFL